MGTADAVAVLDKVLDARGHAQGANIEKAIGRRKDAGGCRSAGFGEMAEIGRVVTEVVGLVHHKRARLTGFEVSGSGDAQHPGEVGSAVDVPATVAAGLLKKRLPAAAEAAERFSVAIGVKDSPDYS